MAKDYDCNFSVNAYTLFSISCETNYNQWDSLQQMSPYGFFEKLEKIHLNKDEAVKVLNIISKAIITVLKFDFATLGKHRLFYLFSNLITKVKYVHEIYLLLKKCNGSFLSPPIKHYWFH